MPDRKIKASDWSQFRNFDDYPTKPRGLHSVTTGASPSSQEKGLHLPTKGETRGDGTATLSLDGTPLLPALWRPKVNAQFDVKKGLDQDALPYEPPKNSLANFLSKIIGNNASEQNDAFAASKFQHDQEVSDTKAAEARAEGYKLAAEGREPKLKGDITTAVSRAANAAENENAPQRLINDKNHAEMVGKVNNALEDTKAKIDYLRARDQKLSELKGLSPDDPDYLSQRKQLIADAGKLQRDEQERTIKLKEATLNAETARVGEIGARTRREERSPNLPGGMMQSADGRYWVRHEAPNPEDIEHPKIKLVEVDTNGATFKVANGMGAKEYADALRANGLSLPGDPAKTPPVSAEPQAPAPQAPALNLPAVPGVQTSPITAPSISPTAPIGGQAPVNPADPAATATSPAGVMQDGVMQLLQHLNEVFKQTPEQEATEAFLKSRN